MAKTLQADTPFPLLLDPEHTAREAFDINNLTAIQMFGPTSALNYAKALGGLRNFAAHPSDANRTPAIVILDANQNVSWMRVGKALGDYPSIDGIMAKIPAS